MLPEISGFNNTLASYLTCSGEQTGSETSKAFISHYLEDARFRLSKYLPSAFNMTVFDVFAMQSLCAYESTSLAGSSFCSLFTEQEWKDFAYTIDIQFYGNYGWGSSVGRAQGIGYVLELAARLEQKLITSSDTSINYTYDDNAAQFPLGQPFYLDMSHDDIIVSVMTALSLEHFQYPESKGLPGDVEHAPDRTFSISEMTPFGARFMTEVWTCPSNVSFDALDPVLYANPYLQESSDTTDYIRFVLNSAPLPMAGLKGCEGAKNGFCPVDQFLRAVPKLKASARFQEACFGDH